MVFALELEKLTKTYSNNVIALKGISLNVKQGDFYALLGLNGAGKSTIIGIITTLVKKTSGQVNVFGYNIDSNIIGLKHQLGLVPQDFNFNPFETVYQIVIYQAGYYGVERKIATIRAEKYLRQLDLWDKRMHCARMLSGGMKRRLMIVRALIHKPKLLILDEPTAGLDIELRQWIWQFLIDLNKKGITIILTTHYLEEAEVLCRHIGIIQQGRLIENASIQKLLSTLKYETYILELATQKESIKIQGYNEHLINNNMLEIKITRKSGALNKLFESLNKQKIQVLSIRNKVNKLEELFMMLVKKNIKRYNND